MAENEEIEEIEGLTKKETIKALLFFSGHRDFIYNCWNIHRAQARRVWSGEKGINKKIT